jgi:bifunctional ADP-heptose synthase (sugar kinase/adenylyltransferase)
MPLRGPTSEKIRMRAGEHLLLRLDRGDAASPLAQLGPVPPAALAAVRSAGAILVSDYGRGLSAHPELTVALGERAGRVPVVWDPHPKGPAPVPGARLVTPNLGEAAGFMAALKPALSAPRANGNGSNGNGAGPAGVRDPRFAGAAADARRLRQRWNVHAVVVTLAERGAVLCEADGPPLPVPAPFAAVGDACGAGDRFATAAVTALAAGASTVDSVRTAVDAATAYVAAGGALALNEPFDEPEQFPMPSRQRSG